MSDYRVPRSGGWRMRTKEIIRRYPELCRAENELHMARLTAPFEEMRSGNEASRTTEALALRELPPEDQRELDAIRNAIATTMRYRNGTERIKLVELVFWRPRPYPLRPAAERIHVSYHTAQVWHADFIALTDAYMRIK